MHTNAVMKKLLRIEKIVIENMYFEDTATGEMIFIVKVRPEKRESNRCPKCGKTCPGYNDSQKIRRWRSLDFGSQRVYIENLTENQQATLEMLIKSDKKLYRAYLLKENLRLCFHYDNEEAVLELEKWLKWAERCRISEFVELCKKIKRHKPAILNSFKYHLTNARIEAINNKIKVTIRMGYGFRNIDNLIALVRLKCGNENITLPGRIAKKKKIKSGS